MIEFPVKLHHFEALIRVAIMLEGILLMLQRKPLHQSEKTSETKPSVGFLKLAGMLLSEKSFERCFPCRIVEGKHPTEVLQPSFELPVSVNQT